MSKSKIRAIIPCAGFGTRMGMLPHESKEMLLHNGSPIIDYVLELCDICNIEPVIITRPIKKDLIDYVKDKAVVVKYNPTGEWAETVLYNRKHWGDKNILILPDTRFSHPVSTLYRIKYKLAEYPVVLATHTVPDPWNWGYVTEDGYIREKPRGLAGRAEAWGLIGFHKSVGTQLFKYRKSDIGNWVKLPEHFKVPMTSFEDITRGK